MPKPQPPVWRMPPFAALFADPFISGTELESGHVAYSCVALSYSIERFVRSARLSDGSYLHESLFSGNDLDQLSKVKAALDLCARIAVAPTGKPEEFSELVKEIIGKVKSLADKDILMVPGGWEGETTSGTVVHLIGRDVGGSAAGGGAASSEAFMNKYSFFVCNSGEGMGGLEYHPSSPDYHDVTSGKTKYKTCLRIPNVPEARLTDPAFWMILLGQRVKQPPGEYQRSEVLYDALLPWLAGDRLLPGAISVGGNYLSSRVVFLVVCSSFLGKDFISLV